MLNLLHTLSGLAIIIFLLDKVFVHYIMDRRQGKVSGFASFLFAPGQYLLLYRPEVPLELRSLKKLCNLFWWLALASILANLVIGILIYQATQHG